MGVVDMARRIKVVHPDFLIMYKLGTFYKTFGKDAYILSSIFGYKYSMIEENVPMSSFPTKSLNKVRHKLENLQVNYILIDTRNNYDVDYKESFNNLNQYNKVLNSSCIQIKNMRKIERITQELTRIMYNQNFKDIIRRMEDILDENGEI